MNPLENVNDRKARIIELYIMEDYALNECAVGKTNHFVIPCHHSRKWGKAGIQLIEETPRSGSISRFCPLRGVYVSLDSRLRWNDG